MLSTVCFCLSFLFAAAACVATHISWVSPKCRRNYLPAKMICSGGFLLTAVFTLAATGFQKYGWLILIALFFGAWGDFFLEWKQAKYFYAGVVCFAIGHGFYIYNFLTADAAAQPKPAFLLIAFACVVVLNFIFMQFEKIKFKGGHNVMMAYAVVLICMFVIALWRCVADFRSGAHLARGVLVLIAGLLFVISDSFLGSQLYGKSHVKHPEAIVLYTYFPAQILFALSTLFA